MLDEEPEPFRDSDSGEELDDLDSCGRRTGPTEGAPSCEEVRPEIVEDEASETSSLTTAGLGSPDE